MAAVLGVSVCDVCHESNPELGSHRRSHTFTYADDAERAYRRCREVLLTLREQSPLGSPEYDAFLSALRAYRALVLPMRSDVHALQRTLRQIFSRDEQLLGLRRFIDDSRFKASVVCELALESIAPPVVSPSLLVSPLGAASPAAAAVSTPPSAKVRHPEAHKLLQIMREDLKMGAECSAKGGFGEVFK
jgi:hypothetical protein